MQINEALEKLDDDSGLTHTVLLPNPNSIMDVTIEGVYYFPLPDWKREELFVDNVSCAIRIEWLYPHLQQQIMADNINRMIRDNVTLKVEDIKHWFRHKGNKDNILLCTDIALEVTELNEYAPINLLPSQLLSWFESKMTDKEFLADHDIKRIIKVTNKEEDDDYYYYG